MDTDSIIASNQTRIHSIHQVITQAPLPSLPPKPHGRRQGMHHQHQITTVRIVDLGNLLLDRRQ